MKRIGILIFILTITIFSYSQKKTNIKIGKTETEVALFVIGELDPTIGVQLVYRLPLLKNMKIGGGVLYGANIEGAYGRHETLGYGAVFADALQLFGKRQKWGVGGQIGKGIYNHDIGFDKIKAGIYYTVLFSCRAIVSKKLLLTTSLFIGHRNFHYSNTGYSTSLNYTAFTGLKLGFVF